MYKINGDQVELVEPDTFSFLQWTEQDIEDLIRRNINHDEEFQEIVM